MTINEQINVVVEAREKAAEFKRQRNVLLEEWNKANQELFDNLTQAGAGVAEAESKLRELALETYAETKDKAVAPGIGIRVLTKLNYEAKEALKWATDHNLALKLDTSVFEKIAKTSDIDFVIISEEPSATIATELTKVGED